MGCYMFREGGQLGVLRGMEYPKVNGGPGLQIVKILHIFVQNGQFYAGGKYVGRDFPPPTLGQWSAPMSSFFLFNKDYS